MAETSWEKKIRHKIIFPSFFLCLNVFHLFSLLFILLQFVRNSTLKLHEKRDEGGKENSYSHKESNDDPGLFVSYPVEFLSFIDPGLSDLIVIGNTFVENSFQTQDFNDIKKKSSLHRSLDSFC